MSEHNIDDLLARIDELEIAIHHLEAENARLRAIVNRLPKTADGVPVIPFVDQVYSVQKSDISDEPALVDWHSRDWGWCIHEAEPVSQCFSTLERAKEQAQARSKKGKR
ncbi:MAG: hypothetical protein HZA50_10610 [Planctomycetes bacterium]|nr:hypothetical protein [Planctomycetota bacterium]